MNRNVERSVHERSPQVRAQYHRFLKVCIGPLSTRRSVESSEQNVLNRTSRVFFSSFI